MKYIISILIVIALVFTSCTKTEVLTEEYYSCQLPFSDSSDSHPNALAYQDIIESNRKLGTVGVSVMVKDEHGVWLGTAGMADIANNIELKPCQQLFIASITKVFTAAMIYTFVEDGTLRLDDYVTDWIGESTLKNLANADQAQIKHLLNHTSGIPDYYTMSYDMMRLNADYNGLSHEEVLEYAKGLDANNKVGAAYRYCNTNFLLLGMIMEESSGQKLTNLFNERIFAPAQLYSAYYGGDNPIPDGAVKGYVDIYGDGKYVESKFLYKDELNTADGGIAITAYETGLFFEKLLKGEVINESSLSTMLTSFELPEGWWDPKYHTMEGANGIEKFLTPYGVAYGHTGSIMGFNSIVQYFPESDRTFVMIVNSASYHQETQENIYNSCMDIMFNQ